MVRRAEHFSRSGASKVIISGGGLRALPEGIHAAAVEIVAVPLRVGLGRKAVSERDLFPESIRLVGMNTGPADLSVSADRLKRVRHRESFQRADGSAGRARADGFQGRVSSSSGLTRDDCR